MRRAGSIHVGPAPVHAARISYAGELGWELTTPVEWAVTVWDRLRAAGAEPIGYRALDALRMEKGYRYYGTDLTMLDTPVRGRSRRLRPARGGSVHRARRARRGPRRRLGPPPPNPRHRRRRLRTHLRRRGRPPRWRRRRPSPQRRLRPDRRADDRLRLPAGIDRRKAPSSRSTSSIGASARSSAPDVLVDPRGRADARLGAPRTNSPGQDDHSQGQDDRTDSA